MSQTLSRPPVIQRDPFGVRARGSSPRVEILGGLSTFMAMSYIVLVNPAILAKGGIPWQSAFLATALVSGLATIAMGLWARLPFAVAPGMEVNALVVFSVIGTHGFSWQEALGLVMWSGLLMVAVTLLGWRGKVIEAIPPEIRSGLVLSVAVFIGLVGLKVAGVSGRHPGSLLTREAVALYIGFGLAMVLGRLGVRAAVLIAIAAASVFCWLAGMPAQATPAGHGPSALFALDLGVIANPLAWGMVLVLFALDFFGSLAKLVGLSANTSIQESGEVPRIRQALYVDSLATVGGAAIGSTSFVTFVESGVGIRAGARTGLASVVTGTLLVCCVAITPIAGWIPASAATGALLYVAVGLLPARAELTRTDRLPLAVSVLMAIVTALTSALDQALLAGLALYLAGGLVRGRRPGAVLLLITVLLGLSVVLQYTTS